MTDLITGVFHDRAEADRAAADLQRIGFAPEDISIVMHHPVPASPKAEAPGTKAAEGAGIGAGIGGTLGAILAALTATGSVIVLAATGGLAAPLVAGPLAAALAGAGAGGLTGGVIGGLIGAGIPEEHAHVYAEGLNQGGILLAVHAAPSQIADVQAILKDDGADDVQGPEGLLMTSADTAQGSHSTDSLASEISSLGGGVDMSLLSGDYPGPAEWQAPLETLRVGPSRLTMNTPAERALLHENDLLPQSGGTQAVPEENTPDDLEEWGP